jgi:hypothetical protein
MKFTNSSKGEYDIDVAPTAEFLTMRAEISIFATDHDAVDSAVPRNWEKL